MSVWREPEDFRALPSGRKLALRAGGAPRSHVEASALRSHAQWELSGGALVMGLGYALGFLLVPLLMGAVLFGVLGAIAGAVVMTGLRLAVASSSAKRAYQFLDGTP